MVSLGGIVTFIKHAIFTLIFILFIPGFFFQLPKNGSKRAVAAVHGLLYALVYTLLEVVFNIRRITMCMKTGGMGSV
jgi:hypothetical protein